MLKDGNGSSQCYLVFILTAVAVILLLQTTRVLKTAVKVILLVVKHELFIVS